MSDHDEVWYGVEGQEQLDQTIEDVLDNYDEGTPVEILVFRKMKITGVDRMALHVLEGLLEDLDDDYRDPGGDSTKPTEGMKAAAKAFVEAVVKEYNVWACQPTGEVIKAVAGEEVDAA